jgi:hypothetical protein
MAPDLVAGEAMQIGARARLLIEIEVSGDLGFGVFDVKGFAALMHGSRTY